jgi:hypothetical protein
MRIGIVQDINITKVFQRGLTISDHLFIKPPKRILSHYTRIETSDRRHPQGPNRYIGLLDNQQSCQRPTLDPRSALSRSQPRRSLCIVASSLASYSTLSYSLALVLLRGSLLHHPLLTQVFGLHHLSPPVSSLPSISHGLHNSTNGGDRSNPDNKIAWKGQQSSWRPARAFVRVPMVCLAVLAAIIDELAVCTSKFGRRSQELALHSPGFVTGAVACSSAARLRSKRNVSIEMSHT